MKCIGNVDGIGCKMCLRKGVRCEYSAKKKPGPKCRKREDSIIPAGLGSVNAPPTAVTPPIPLNTSVFDLPGTGARSGLSPSPNSASDGRRSVIMKPFTAAGPTAMRGYIVSNGVVTAAAAAVHTRSQSFDAEEDGGVGYHGGGGSGGTAGTPVRHSMTSSCSSQHLLTPSKKARPTHDAGVRTVPSTVRTHSEEFGDRQQHQQEQEQRSASSMSQWLWDPSAVRSLLFLLFVRRQFA